MSEITIIPANPKHAEGIYDVRDAVLWRAERKSGAYINSLLGSPDHQTFVAVTNETVVGFVDGFLTLSQHGVLRWEVDLLGVARGYQGQGIGSRLVTASTHVGAALDAKLARALIEIRNTSSEKSFTKNGYVPGDECELMITSDRKTGSPSASAGYFIPVSTISYQGVWIEGERSYDALIDAQHICGRHQWDIAGAVIPKTESNALIAAEQAGYRSVGQYRWWTCTL